jgi:16S rRNA (cytidine1402-2'-O)-methyltransferase
VGKIILLNTPIGNLGDISQRVLEALRAGEVFAVEDTRVFKELLNHLGITVSGKRILSLHDQSAPSQISKLIELAENHTLYVASEAGSPIISDPAFPLVIKAYEKGLKVESFSGVSSPIMALELSGLPPIPFTFHGFLPREPSKRKKIFVEAGYGTHIFFEAPTRVEQTLCELSDLRPQSDICVVRELSKKFEQVLRFKGEEWESFNKEFMAKGEFVVLFHNKDNSSSSNNDLVEIAEEMLTKGAAPKSVAKLISVILNRPTKDIYSLLSRQNKEDQS